jgi:hypothetical protein|nr:MAG TPA: hypothetical protein [Caudoviricetes sp.]
MKYLLIGTPNPIDNLSSSDSKKYLSANQGRVLKSKIDSIGSSGNPLSPNAYHSTSYDKGVYDTPAKLSSSITAAPIGSYAYVRSTGTYFYYDVDSNTWINTNVSVGNRGSIGDPGTTGPIGEQGDPGSNGTDGNINITMNLDSSGNPTTNGVKSSDFKTTVTKCNTTMTNLNKDFNLADDTYVYLRYNGTWKKILKSKWNHWLEHDLYS